MKNTNRNSIIYFVFTIAILFLPFFNVNAATLGFSSASSSYKVGDTINVKVYVNSSLKSINAISANIKYSNDILSLSSISKTGSIINLWAQEPLFSNTTGIASLEGVVLSGYNGTSGNIVTLVFKAKTTGVASIKFNSGSVLANDGNGTEVLSSKGTSTLNILAAQTPIIPSTPSSLKKITDNKEEVITKDPIEDTTIVISEIKNKSSQYSLNKFLITSPQPVVDKSYTIQIDGMPSIIWVDDGTHVFQASDLVSGEHVIKVMAVDTNSDSLSGFLNFSSTVLKIPTITYYPTDLYVDQFLVLKGITDPSVNVEIIIKNVLNGEIITDRVTTNSDGKFIYVPENKIKAGIYSVIARASVLSGVNSDYINPIQIISKEYKFNFFVSKFGSYLVLLIPIIALIFFVIIMILYLSHHTKRIKKSLSKKFASTENIVSKSFDILGEDLDDEMTIFRKIRDGKLLTKDEQTFLIKFKKDIIEAEKIIQKELKEVEK